MGCDGVFETFNHQELLKYINDELDKCEFVCLYIHHIQSVNYQEDDLKFTVEGLLDHLLAPST